MSPTRLSSLDAGTPLASPGSVAKTRAPDLTANQALRIEDILTGAFTDNVNFCTCCSVVDNLARENPKRSPVQSLKYGVHNIERWKPNPAKIRAIIDDFRQYPDDEEQALRELLASRGLRGFQEEKLSEGRQQKAFEALLLAYLRASLPGNAFRVSSTTKYLSKEEACVIATRHVAKGEIIPNLDGRRVPLTEEELEKLVERKKDFSVLDATRHCRTSLLVGPPHLINHSCDPNAELQVMGDKWVVKVAARRHIAEGEEITISYGDEYFGNKNQDCLCEPCEKKKLVEPEKQTTADRAEDGVLKGHSGRRCRAAKPKRNSSDPEHLPKETGRGRPGQRRQTMPVQTSNAKSPGPLGHSLPAKKREEKPAQESGVHPPAFSLKTRLPVHSPGRSPKKRKANPVQASSDNASLSPKICLLAQSLGPPSKKRQVIPDHPSKSRIVEAPEKSNLPPMGKLPPPQVRKIAPLKKGTNTAPPPSAKPAAPPSTKSSAPVSTETTAPLNADTAAPLSAYTAAEPYADPGEAISDVLKQHRTDDARPRLLPKAPSQHLGGQKSLTSRPPLELYVNRKTGLAVVRACPPQLCVTKRGHMLKGACSPATARDSVRRAMSSVMANISVLRFSRFRPFVPPNVVGASALATGARHTQSWPKRPDHP